jgi:transposase
MSDEGAQVIPGLVVRRGRMGRCTYSVEGKRALAQRALQPGVSVARLALTHGINANVLRKWVRRYGSCGVSSGSSETSSSSVLLPVAIANEAKNTTTGSSESCIEIVWAAATVRLRGPVDLRSLGIVLDCLAQRA